MNEIVNGEPDYKQISASLKLLAHPERLRILDVLRREAECVCHLEALLNKPQPYVSQQLRLLRELNVIQDEKVGNNVYYRLVDPEITAWLEHILGSVTGEHPGIARHKQVIACPCPKCGESELPIKSSPVPLEFT
jgi:DNA-binding transcriptional ArsR family regulator